MSPKLQRHVSKIFHRRISSPEKEEKESADSEEDESAPPKSPRSRPTFSLSSLSFRRQNVNTPSILTPPHTPPLISTTFSSSPSSVEDEEEEEGENVLHIRNPPPSLHESEQSPSLVTNPTSYFDFSPSHFSHLQQELATDRFHAHTAPPSPLSTQNGLVLSSSRRRPNLLEPPISANRFDYFTSSSSSSVSRVNAEDGGENEPKSAFSDWGTSVGGGTESRNTSSEDLSESEDERKLLPTAEGVKGVSEGEGKEGKEEKGEKAQKVNEEKEEEVLKFLTPPNSHSPSTPAPADPIRRTSTSAVTPPRSSLENSPPPPPSSHSHSQTHSRHHRHHNHHHHTSKLMGPKESRVAESSYPELAIAFFMSLKKFKGRKLDRRASTGSLGGAV